MNDYKSYDNYSVKYIEGYSYCIPEIIVYGDSLATISLPQPESPRKISMAYKVKGKNKVKPLEGYFTILWNNAYPIFVDGKLYTEEIKKLRIKYKI